MGYSIECLGKAIFCKNNVYNQNTILIIEIFMCFMVNIIDSG